jgi:hypothetical protein
LTELISDPERLEIREQHTADIPNAKLLVPNDHLKEVGRVQIKKTNHLKVHAVNKKKRRLFSLQ